MAAEAEAAREARAKVTIDFRMPGTGFSEYLKCLFNLPATFKHFRTLHEFMK